MDYLVYNDDTKSFKKLCTLTKNERTNVLNELTDYASKFLYDNYGIKLVVPIVLDRKSKRTLGTFANTHVSRLPALISLYTDMVAIAYHRGNLTGVRKILRHELIHYALFMLNKPSNDGDKLFEQELDKYDAPSSATTRTNKVSKTFAHVLLPVDLFTVFNSYSVVTTIALDHTTKPTTKYQNKLFNVKINGANYKDVILEQSGYGLRPSDI